MWGKACSIHFLHNNFFYKILTRQKEFEIHASFGCLEKLVLIQGLLSFFEVSSTVYTCRISQGRVFGRAGRQSQIGNIQVLPESTAFLHSQTYLNTR